MSRVLGRPVSRVLQNDMLRTAPAAALKSMCLAAIMAVLTCLVPLDANASATFTVEDVHTIPVRFGTALSIGVDPSGNPHIGYNREMDLNGSFRHAYKQGGAWRHGTIVDLGTISSSFAFHGSNLFTPYTEPGAGLKFASYDGSNWSTEPVDNLFPSEGAWASLAFDRFSRPHLGYYEGAGANNAKHAFKIGPGMWSAEIADGFATPEMGLYTSIALSADDTVFISHVGRPTGGTLRLRLSELSGPQWESITVDSTINAMGGTAIVVTATGQPIIAFTGSAAGSRLYLARRVTPTAWSIEEVDTVGPSDVALDLDSFGQPHILYRKNFTSVRHAYLDAFDGWMRETIATAQINVPELDMDIGPSDVLHVVYNESFQNPSSSAHAVRYARGTFGSWTIETVEGREDEGAALAITRTTAGQPVVVFHDATRRDVQFARRTDFNSWIGDDIAEDGDVGRLLAIPPRDVPPTTVDVVYFDATNSRIVQRTGSYDAWTEAAVIPAGSGIVGLSYADSSGWGRVAYYDSIAGDVLLARLGPGGTSVTAVDQTGDVGRSCSMALTSDGTTHIVYYDATLTRLRHARSTDGAWMFATVDSGTNVGRRCSLGANGMALKAAYYDGPAGDLHWGVWHGGSSWTTYLADATGDVGNGCSIGIIGTGAAGISYYDATNGNLKYARVYDSGLADVNTVDAGFPTTADVGGVSAITIDQATGVAEIAYYDASKGLMKYAKEAQTASVPGSPPASSWLRIFPNPVARGGEVRVACSQPVAQIGDVALFDLMGRSIGAARNVRLGGGVPAVGIMIPGRTSGIVFVHVRLRDGQSAIVRAAVLQ